MKGITLKALKLNLKSSSQDEEKYLQPLKYPENAGLLDAFLVDEIFYQVPEILNIHQVFLEHLRRRLEQWDLQQKVGDVFLDVFKKPTVMDTYMSFINNLKKAKETVKMAAASRPAFARFLDAMVRDHKGKLSIDNLLIKPVQKFPSYKLLFQRLIKHTAQQSFTRLRTVFGDEAPYKTSINIWFAEIKRDCVNLSDEFRDGCLFTSVNDKNIDAVRRMIETDRHVTYHEI
ncbi:Rho guanine nucleotide exchange factor 17 [Eumeta japonica]|uniref:Rho guanine nucleotide exchange factor 17 n=1 Tax=Eumeta variegata TaxID=151549 RepID=A0A4C1U752_EUMVA|nr:Rho guanine nucleotide exchange factor 17 [Eumeta japonica]